jgi:hypothetical protein
MVLTTLCRRIPLASRCSATIDTVPRSYDSRVRLWLRLNVLGDTVVSYKKALTLFAC